MTRDIAFAIFRYSLEQVVYEDPDNRFRVVRHEQKVVGKWQTCQPDLKGSYQILQSSTDNSLRRTPRRIRETGCMVTCTMTPASPSHNWDRDARAYSLWTNLSGEQGAIGLWVDAPSFRSNFHHPLLGFIPVPRPALMRWKKFVSLVNTLKYR